MAFIFDFVLNIVVIEDKIFISSKQCYKSFFLGLIANLVLLFVLVFEFGPLII